MKNLILIAILLSGYFSYSQCTNFHQEQCTLPADWPYEFDTQSISAGIFPGQAFRIKTVLYEGNDYYLGLCKQEGIGNIQYKILINNIEIDNNLAQEANKNLIYFEMSIERTTTAVIEVKLEKAQVVNYTLSELKCLGIIIGNKNSEKLIKQ
jgi:hypothetical protein